MADSNHNRRDDYLEFSENDPFAELTRIMGHDPREAPEEAARQAEPATPAQGHVAAAPADDGFDLDLNMDLERELAADLDFSDFDEQPVAPAQIIPEQIGLDAEFDEFFAEETAAPEPEPALYETYQPEVPAAVAEQRYESLDAALEQELFADQALWAEPEPVYTEPVYTEAAYSEPAYDDVAYEAVPYSDEPAPELALFEAQPATVKDEATAEDSWAVEAEFDIDFLERELAAASAADQPGFEPFDEVIASPPASFEAEPFGEPEEYVGSEPVEPVAEEPAERVLSLEEELQLLLAGEAPPAAPDIVAPPPVAASTNFGRANFAAAASVAAPAVYAPPAFVPATAEYPQDVASPFVTPVETAEAAEAHQPPAGDEYFEPAVPDSSAVPVSPTVPDTDDGIGDIFGDDFVFHLDDEIADQAQAIPVTASAPQQPEQPEIETVEVAEIVPPVTDDLDIPEIDYGTTTASAPDFHDNFQSDFDHLFGDVATAEVEQAAAAVIAEPAAGQQVPHDDFLDNMQWQTPQPDAAAGYDFETDLEQAIAMSAYEDQSPPASRRRGLFVAAAVGGIVVLGAAGVFGVSMLGGGSDNPAIVRADPEPMKVRPENPGGTTVPNQDNEVYQRVSGTGSNAGPFQEQLITSAEEPVDVVARTVTPQEPAIIPAPGIDEGGAAEAGPVKSEERIEQVPQATSPVEAQETAMVTPRRVRTMVVRPDGTMVPREDPVTASEPAIAEQQPVTTGEATALAPMEQPVQPADEIDGAPVPEMPQTVSVVPTRRSEPSSQPVAAAPQPVAPQPAASQPAPSTQVAAAPVPAPAAAAATGEWSMQIASQPTAEGAQSSYQDLARRYGSVLEGRGVSIVRADIDGRGTYYRVRIPASSRDEAIQLCTRYKAAGGSCFVSR